MTGRLNCRWDTANACTNGWRKRWRVRRRIPRKNRARAGVSGDAVDERMSNPFGGEEEQGQDRESNLKALRVQFFPRDRLLTPLRCGATAKASNFPNNIQIDDRSQEGQEHHGDADGVLMEAASGGVNSSGGGEGAEADGHTDTADGNDGGAGALENRERDAGPIEELAVEIQDPLPVRSGGRLRDFCLVLYLFGHIRCLMTFLRITVPTSDRRRREVEG